MRPEMCPSAGELAKLIDGRLSESEARRVRTHLASCEDCTEVVSESLAFLADEEAVAVGGEEPHRGRSVLVVADPVPVRMAIGRWLPLAAVLVLAVGLATAWWIASRPDDFDALATAQGEYRRTLVRVSGLPHAPPEPVLRSDDGYDAGYALLAEASRLEAVVREEPSVSHFHALGVARLMAHRYDEAISALETAQELEPAPKLEVELEADLAAALLERGIETGDLRSVARAQNLLAAQVEGTPNPGLLFNRALALEELRAVRQAIRAWDAYLEVDEGSPWADEARRRQRALQVRQPEATGPSAEAIEDRVLSDLLAVANGPAPTDLEATMDLARGYEARFRDPWLVDLAVAVEVTAAAEREEWAALLRRHGELRQARRAGAAGFCSEPGLEDRSGLAGAEPLELSLSILQGGCAYLRNDLSAAGRIGREVVDRGSARGYVVLAGQGAWLAGLVAHAERRSGAAIRWYVHSDDFLRRAGDQHRLAALRARKGKLLAFSGLRRAAWNDAIASLEQPGQAPERLHQALHMAAQLAQQEGWPFTHLAFLAEATDLGSSVTPDHRADTLRDLGLAFGYLGRGEAAERAFQQAEEAVSAILDPTLRRRTEALVASDRADFLAEREPLKAQRYLRSAEAAAEPEGGRFYVRADIAGRIALALGDSTQAEGVLLSALEAANRELDALHRLDQRAALLQVRGQLLQTYVHWLVENQRDLEAWQAVVANRGRVLSGGPPRGNGPATTDAGPSALALTFFSLRDELLVWRSEGGRVTLRRVDLPRSELERQVQHVKLWAEGDRPRVGGGDPAATLAQTLFEPGDLSRSRLILIPDEVTSRLPFAALPHPEFHRPIPLYTTLVVSPALRSQPTSPGSALNNACILLVEGAQVGGTLMPELRRLRRVKEELAIVASFYKCQRYARTVAEIVEALEEGVDRIHFAGHLLAGIHGGLLLDVGGKLEVVSPEEFESWPLAGVGVSLSGCSGALSSPEGAGLTSLTHAFLRAGASAVVAAQWAVSDDEALALGRDLHRDWARGVDLATALNRVQVAAIQDDKPARPWAGWVTMAGYGGKHS